MPLFEFSIIATGLKPNHDSFEQQFIDEGVDDATISFQRGLIILDFCREAPSMVMALETAIEAVVATGATVVRVEPDPLVTLSDIAERANLSRAAVSLYAKGERGEDFPLPIARVTSDSPLWLWAEVAQWLAVRGRIPLSIADDAYSIALITRGLTLDDNSQRAITPYRIAG